MRSTAFLFVVMLALGNGASGNAVAQSWPIKPVTVISAFPPANNDQIIRMVDGRFQAAYQQALVIENRPGAGGNIGAEAVARAAPDGHTLLVTVDTVVTVNPRIYATLKFKADADLVPVIYLANTAQTLACHPSVPVKSVAELVAHARSHDLSYASGGQGVPGHLAAEMFLAATGVRMTHIPYKGPSAALQDLMGGNVHCGFLATPTVMPHVKSGKLTGLAVTSTRRSPIAMELPTMNEAGIAGLEASFGQLLLAPKGTPATVVAALNETFSAALAQADVRARMLAMDLEFVPNTPEQAEARLRSEAEKWARVVDRLGLRAD
ncbi:MAG: tripartite tricarboxylate transporter substrate binding protein [Rubrivivax sp.]|nr:tripartite tricarboxylate transporter substrate binding protein [Rubrivivax sp.]